MNSEILILRGLYQSREVYDKLKPVIDSTWFSGQGKPIYSSIAETYEKDPNVQSIDFELFNIYLDRVYVNKAKKLIEFTEEYLQQEIPSVDLVLHEVVQHKKELLDRELINLLGRANKNDKAIDELIAQRQQFNELDISNLDSVEEKDVPEVLIGAGIDTVTQAYEQDNLLRLYPKVLNDLLGGGIPVHTHLLYYGRPNVAKTALTMATICGNIRNGIKVLVCSNEEGTEAYLMRIWSRLSEKTREQIMSSPKQVYDYIVEHKGYMNLVYAPMYPGTIDYIEKLIGMYEPKLVVVDQIRQLQVGTRKVDGEVAQLTQAVKGMRRLIKQYPIVGISVTQAGENADGVLKLGQEHVYGSKTTAMADVDVGVGIGMDDWYEKNNKRMLHLARDKVTGNNGGTCEVGIIPNISKVISL